MNPSNNKQRNMHFKSAQISAAELSPNEMAMINAYALSPLSPEEVFAFKVSMACNDIDRDFEVFPLETLKAFANLFVGRTVVKDHDHRSDNQIARIYATNLVEGEPMRMTKAGEIYTELIAKCYMVKTTSNADLISEIQAGIRKEVSLGCRIGKAVCSVCGKDNVKQYCNHFPGKEYKGETCYFSLEDPTDAYELSFVAIPAQQHAGTVKSYGEKPCTQAELEAKEAEQEARQEAEQADELGNRLTVNQVDQADDQNRLTVNQVEQEDCDQNRLTVNRFEEEETRLTVNQNDEVPAPGSEAGEGEPPAGAEEGAEDGAPSDDVPAEGELPSSAAPHEEHAGEESGLDSSEDAGEADDLEKAEEAEKSDSSDANTEDGSHEGVTSKALDDFAEKLQDMWERIEACGKLLDKMEATILEITSKGAAGAVAGEPQETPASEQAEQDTSQEGEQADDQGSRLTVDQVEEDSSSDAAPDETTEDSAGCEPAITLADEEEAREELKAKQAQARLRALEMALSIRTRA